MACIVHGALYFLPLYIVTMVVGVSWEVLFAIIRRRRGQRGLPRDRHAVSADPAADDAALAGGIGIGFGIVLAKEIFGGTGMNFLNPALAARAFLFFAYPARDHRRHASGRRATGARGRRLLRRDVARSVRRMTGPFAEPGPLVVDGVPRPRAGLDGRDLGAGVPARRRAPDLDRHRLVADDGRRRRSARSRWRGFNLIGSATNPYSRCRSGGTW